MYLVELRPGKEELYRSTDELAAAIRSGDVDRHSRIYHRATSKWISVTLHPQFKAIIAEQPPAAPAEPTLPPLERSSWTFFNDAADTLVSPEPEAPAAEAADAPQPLESEHPWRRPLALCVAGGFLILGIQLATSGPRPPWAASTAGSTAVASPAPSAPAEATDPDGGTTMSLASNRTSYPLRTSTYDADPAVDAPPRVDSTEHADSIVLPAAPRVRVYRVLHEALAQPETPAASGPSGPSVGGLLAGWSAAHDSARARLESGMRVARLGQLFASSRLGAGGGVTETRMSLAGLANFIRVYRQQQAVIEREYQDSFAVVSRQLKWSPAVVRAWYAKPRQTEPPALAALTTSLMNGIDSLLGVLDGQAGAYKVAGNTISFEDPAAARDYTALRQRIAVQVDSARAIGAPPASPMGQLLQAIGTTRLPQAS